MTTEAALYRLMTWLSPSYPLGAFSYSHGLEFAVESAMVRDRASLGAWVATAVAARAGRSDGALLSGAWSAVARERPSRARRDYRACPSLARHRGDGAREPRPGRRLSRHDANGLAASAARRASAAPPRRGGAAGGGGDRGGGAGRTARCRAYCLSPRFATTLVSAGGRLIPLGQSDGQRVIAELEGVVADAAETVLVSPLGEIGTAAPPLDWCSMRHETQYTRLFRS
jgi:urease accessory protein